MGNRRAFSKCFILYLRQKTTFYCTCQSVRNLSPPLRTARKQRDRGQGIAFKTMPGAHFLQSGPTFHSFNQLSLVCPISTHQWIKTLTGQDQAFTMRASKATVEIHIRKLECPGSNRDILKRYNELGGRQLELCFSAQYGHREYISSSVFTLICLLMGPQGQVALSPAVAPEGVGDQQCRETSQKELSVTLFSGRTTNRILRLLLSRGVEEEHRHSAYQNEGL